MLVDTYVSIDDPTNPGFHLSKKFITGRNSAVATFNVWKVPKTVYNDPTTTVWQGVDSGSVIKPHFSGDSSVDKVIYLHNSLNSNVSRENWKPGDRVYILYDGDNTVAGQRLLVNYKDNYVRGIDEGEVLADAGIKDDGTYVRGRVYDVDGNDIEEPIENIAITNYNEKISRGYEQIGRSTVAIRVTDSAFNLVREVNNVFVRDWRFIRLYPSEL